MSEVADQLIKAYRSTHFRILEPVAFVLRIGEFSKVLAQLYEEKNISSAAFLTAWNPLSRATEENVNEKADQKLRDTLQKEVRTPRRPPRPFSEDDRLAG